MLAESCVRVFVRLRCFPLGTQTRTRWAFRWDADAELLGFPLGRGRGDAGTRGRLPAGTRGRRRAGRFPLGDADSLKLTFWDIQIFVGLMITLSKLARIICTALLAVSGGVLIAGGVDLVQLDNILELVAGVVALLASILRTTRKN